MTAGRTPPQVMALETEEALRAEVRRLTWQVTKLERALAELRERISGAAQALQGEE